MLTISDTLAKARCDAGKSQNFVAKEIGVSLSTVKSWENGYSEPNCDKVIAWFKAIDKPILPYILPILYPSLETLDSDQAVEEALITCIKACTVEQQKKLLFLFYGAHGSSPEGLLEMMTAHLHVPLRDRLNICSSIITNYEVSESLGELMEPDQALPDIDVLYKALGSAKVAVKESKKGYSYED